MEESGRNLMDRVEGTEYDTQHPKTEPTEPYSETSNDVGQQKGNEFDEKEKEAKDTEQKFALTKEAQELREEEHGLIGKEQEPIEENSVLTEEKQGSSEETQGPPEQQKSENETKEQDKEDEANIAAEENGDLEKEEDYENKDQPKKDEEEEEEDDDIDYSQMGSHKLLDKDSREVETLRKKHVRKPKHHRNTPERIGEFVPVKGDEPNEADKFIDEDPQSRKRRLLTEKMDQAIKSKTTRRRKADEDDLERMQDDWIDFLKDKMIRAANNDVEKNTQGQVATEKLKLLEEVTDCLSKADLATSILDNNLLEAVRLWLEPLPDASMPAYQIQKELINALTNLPIKTDHLLASGIGKVLVFYQRSKRTEPSLKKIVDRLIADWTRPILNKSDSYKDRSVQFHDYNKKRFVNQLSSTRKKSKEAKSLYEENAERRKRAAIPTARTSAYQIAPKVDTENLRRQISRNSGNDEKYKRLNQKLLQMSFKKNKKKSGPSIEGKDLSI